MASNPMNLNLPVPEVTVGPEWATQLNDQLETKIASHDHTVGKGVQVTQAGLNITGDLTMNTQNLTDARSVRFTPKDGVLGNASDINCIYSNNGDLSYIDANGTNIPITANGAIAVGTVGGIDGLGGTNATVGFATDTFTFKQDAATYGNIVAGNVVIHSPNDPIPNYGVTLKSIDGLAADYDLTLPAGLPAQKSFLAMGADGALEAVIPVNYGLGTQNLIENGTNGNRIITQTIAKQKMVPVGQVTWAIPSTSFPLGGNSLGSFTITTTGRPVMVWMQGSTSAATGSAACLKIISTDVGNSRVYYGWYLKHTNQNIYGSVYGVENFTQNNNLYDWAYLRRPVAWQVMIPDLAAGTHTIALFAAQYGGGGTPTYGASYIGFQNYTLIAMEL